MAIRPPIALSAAVVVLTLLTPALAQNAGPPQRVTIPQIAILEGVPTVRVDSNADATTRHVLSLKEGAKDPLTIRVRDGQYYWTSHGDRPLKVSESGAYTYLTMGPGTYIRLTNVNGRLTYVEHVDMEERGSVTWWGELRIAVGR